MSTSTVLASPVPAARNNPNDDVPSASRIRPARSDRSAGKGRRRRAAAEQRREEQQHWSHLMHDSDYEFVVAPRPANRRQSRRAARNVARDQLEECHLFDDQIIDDEDDLDVALAISLSLSENVSDGPRQAVNSSIPGQGVTDMSYESLVLLENVKCTASAAIVNMLIGHSYVKDHHTSSYENMDELCTVCQVEYKDGDMLMVLPCTHTYHEACGSEWFLNHSKLCPICKHDVTEVP